MKEISTYKKFPFFVKSRAKGYYDYCGFNIADKDGTLLISQPIYDGAELKYLSSDRSAPSVSVDISALPDHSAYMGGNICLMPHGNTYKDAISEKLNTNLVNNGCTINKDGIALDFSTTSYLCLKEPFSPKEGDLWEVRMKFTTGSSLGGDRLFHSCIHNGGFRYGIGLALDEKINFFCASSSSGWLFDSYSDLTLENHKTYWIKFGFSGDLYYLDYSLDGQDYTRTLTYESTTPVFPSLNETFFGIYYNNGLSYPMSGSIDLNETKLFINNEVFWEYPQYTPTEENLEGCLYNYEDDGSEVNLDAYCLSSLSNKKHKILLTNGQKPDLPGFESMYLGKLLIPQHDVYDYSETLVDHGYSEIIIENDSISLDESTGIASGFPATDFLKIDKEILPATSATLISRINTYDIYDSRIFNAEGIGIGFYYYKYYISYGGGSYSGSSAPTNEWIYIKLEVKNDVTTLYSLKDSGYSLSDLPPSEDWELVLKIQDNIFNSTRSYLEIGGSSYRPLKGQIDLSNTSIYFDDNRYWSKEEMVPTWSKK